MSGTSRQPRVSVVAYVYNYANWAAEMIDSVLGQSCSDFELFFLDDGSTDGTEEVARRYLPDPRFRYERQERRGRERLHDTFNRCLAATSGEFIAIANGDDVMEPEKLERQIRFLDARPEIDICFHDAVFLDATDIERQGSFRPTVSAHTLETGRLGPYMFSYNRIPNPTVMFRRSVLRRIGMQEYGWAHDYQFWLKAAIAGCKFGFLDDRLVRYRVHGDSHSTSERRSARLSMEADRMRSEMRARYSIEDIYPEIALCEDRDRARGLAHLDLGIGFIEGPQRELALAEAEIRMALQCAPGLGEAKNNLGLVLLMRGQEAEALELFEKAVPEGPRDLGRRNLSRLRARETVGFELAPAPVHGEELFELRSGPAFVCGESPPEASILASIDASCDPDLVSELMISFMSAFEKTEEVSLIFLTTRDTDTQMLQEIHGSASRTVGIDPTETPLIYLQQVRPEELETVSHGHLLSASTIVSLGTGNAARLCESAENANRPAVSRPSRSALRRLVR